MIKYFLQPNPVTPDPNDQSARVKLNATLSLEDIVKLATKRGTSLTETDLTGAANLLFEVITDEVANGNSVTLSLVNVRPGIKGVFASATDSFDSGRHIKRATLSEGLLLSSKMKTAKVEKITAEMPSPVLVEYMDINTGTANSLLTPGGIGNITGEELKYNPENEAEGIWFVPAGGGDAVKVTVVATRTEGRLMFSIPSGLQSGSYTLEVRKGYGTNATLRTGSLNDMLEVS
jgi:hypothetical protein